MSEDIILTPLTQDLMLRFGEDLGEAGLVLPGDDVAVLVRDVAHAQLALYVRTGAVEPWIGYLGSKADDREVIGCCSFVGPPRDGFVEIAYFTFPHAEGRGFAGSMAAGLLSIAKSHAPFPTAFAHTLSEHNASTSVLTRLGFRHVGEATDDEAGRVWRWEVASATAGLDRSCEYFEIWSLPGSAADPPPAISRWPSEGAYYAISAYR